MVARLDAPLFWANATAIEDRLLADGWGRDLVILALKDLWDKPLEATFDILNSKHEDQKSHSEFHYPDEFVQWDIVNLF